MKPNLFQYVRAKSTKDAVSLLEELGEDTQILAGGQSLVPTMALRMANPETLIDISAIAELQIIELSNGVLTIGAGCRYVDILNRDLVVKSAPLLCQAIPYIAHDAIRNRGTIGGSLALADPASELPACMLALNAVIIVESNDGQRKISALDFFQGTYFTALSENELLVAVEIPEIGSNQIHEFHEISRRSGDYAISGGAFVLTLEDSLITCAQLAYFAVSDCAVLATNAAEALEGVSLSPETIISVSDIVAGEIEFFADLYNSEATKKQVTKVLTRRMLTKIYDGIG
ncbi:MAG: molybdopterin dehydrogenase [Blastopirellula sp.]|nr:MAG: molybdopterin dehydrogenase [Blastopirellula sp.]